MVSRGWPRSQIARRLPSAIRSRIRGLLGHGDMLVPVAELEDVYRRSLLHLRERGPVGDYLEFGVYRGESLLCMDRVRRALALTEMRLFAFDSFEGLPDTSAPADEGLGWTRGAFRADYRATRRRLDRAGVDWSRTFLVKGWYDETLTPAFRESTGLRSASVIMIDCDLYSSTACALEFSAPLIGDAAVVVLDDWDGGCGLADRGRGEAAAFTDFLEAHSEFAAEEFCTYFHTEMQPPAPAKAFLVTRPRASGS